MTELRVINGGEELDRIANPCDPLEPHIRVLAGNEGPVVELVPYHGHSVRILVPSATTVAREIYAFATEFAAYRDAHVRDGRRVQLDATIADLEDALEQATLREEIALRAAADDEQRADDLQSIVEEMIVKMESIARDPEPLAIRNRIEGLVREAKRKEKELDSDGSKDGEKDH